MGKTDFEGVSIECGTKQQMLHLASLAEGVGIEMETDKGFEFEIDDFDRQRHFCLNIDGKYTNRGEPYHEDERFTYNECISTFLKA